MRVTTYGQNRMTWGTLGDGEVGGPQVGQVLSLISSALLPIGAGCAVLHLILLHGTATR